MKAFQFVEWQKPGQLREVPEPGPGQVLVGRWRRRCLPFGSALVGDARRTDAGTAAVYARA
jgi:hypothetical protein